MPDFDFDFNFDDEEQPAIVPVEPIQPDLDDQTVIDSMFEDITRGVENDEAVQAAAAKIIEVEALVTQYEAEYHAAEVEREQIAQQRHELEKQIRELARQDELLRQKLFDVRAERNRANRAKQDAEREQAIAREDFEQRRKQEALTDYYVRVAQKFDWYNGLANGNKILKHQWLGAKYLASAERAILGDSMGLGKTLTAIAALDLAGAKKVLVIAPSDITKNFEREIARWAPHRTVMNIRGMNKTERDTVLMVAGYLDEVIIITNYEAWRKDYDLLVALGDFGFDTIILDEAHSFKSTSSEVYKGVVSIAHRDNLCPVCGTQMLRTQGGMVCTKDGTIFNQTRRPLDVPLDEWYWKSKSIKRIWAMTGTPILNEPRDLFALLSVVDPMNFTEAKRFLERYTEQDPYTGRWRFHEGGLMSLTKRIAGRFLARTLEDANIVLPPQEPIIHEIVLDKDRYPNQARVIEQLAKHSSILLADDRVISAFAIIALITRQRQANVWPGGIQLKDDEGNIVFSVSEEITESVKIDFAVDMICDLVDQGERVIVFSKFTEALKEMHKRINLLTTAEGNVIRAVRFDGQTPEAIKDQVRTNFDKSMGEKPKWDVVLAQYQSGGMGLNFTAAHHIIVMDEEWNPGKRDQAYGRNHRIGQDANTYVHILRLPNTIDNWLADLIREKERMIEGFNDSTVDIREELLAALKRGELSG